MGKECIAVQSARNVTLRHSAVMLRLSAKTNEQVLANMQRREIQQKVIGRVNKKLRESAKECPYCMACGLENNSGDLLCLAHSNRLADGKGRGLKAVDEFGAILCARCHDYVDGRAGTANKQERQDYHYEAHCKTYAWWLKKGYLT